MVVAEGWKWLATELSWPEAAAELEIFMPGCTDMQDLAYFQSPQKKKKKEPTNMLVSLFHLIKNLQVR